MKKAFLLVTMLLVLFVGVGTPATAEETTDDAWTREDLLKLPVGWSGDEESLIRELVWGVEQRFRGEYRHGMIFDHDL